MRAAEQLRTPPVFIVGVPRSGTTLLFRTLLRHSSFRPRRPAATTRLVETKAFQKGDGAGPNLLHFMQDDREIYRAYLAASRLPRLLRRAMNSFSIPATLRGRSYALRRVWWRLTGGASLVRCYFTMAAKAREVQRLVEKTPHHALHLPEIAATFPSSRILWMHRHPVDAFASYRKRGSTEVSRGLTPRERNRWLKVTPAIFCRRHREYVAELRRAEEEGLLPMLRVRYEDFTARPAEEFRKVCLFLDEPFEPGPVEGGTADISDPRDPLLSAPIRRKTKRWNEFVSPEECRMIEDLLLEDMSYLGYGEKGTA